MKHYFLHIPKTGGVTVFIEVLSNKNLPIIENKHYIDMFIELQSKCREKRITIDEAIKEYDLPDFDVMISHFNYGIHRAFSGEYLYHTIIREPLEHTKSWLKTLWTYSSNLRFLPSEIKWTDNILLDNYQTRFLVDDGFYVDKITHEHTKQAIKNMENMNVGITEKLQDFCNKTNRIFGGGDIDIGVHNKTIYGEKNYTQRENEFQCIPFFTEKTEKEILEKNFSDVEIYEYAKSLQK